MIWSQWGGLCRHHWVTFLIIPLVLLICLLLIKYWTKISERALLFMLRNPQKLTKINFVFFLNRKSFSGSRTDKVFVVARTRRKLQKQSHFFWTDLVYLYFSCVNPQRISNTKQSNHRWLQKHHDWRTA